MPEARNLVGDAEANEHAMALLRQAEAWRHTQRSPARQVPGQHRCDVLGRAFQFQLSPFAEPAVHFYTGAEILTAPCARIRAGSQSQRPACAEGITELPHAFMNVFYADQILGNISIP